MTDVRERWEDQPFERNESLLERLMAVQRHSALRLQSQGKGIQARNAERAAARIRLALDAPEETERMFRWVREVRAGRRPLLGRALDGAISLLGAERGNIQLRDGRRTGLRIVAQEGFDRHFLEHFAFVADGSSACGRAALQRTPIVIEDVHEDESFEPHCRIAKASRFRAVVSIPLVGSGDLVLGVMSTHFHDPHRPSTRELVLVEWYAQQVADALVA